MRYSLFVIFSILIVTLALTSCGGDSGDTDDENGGIGGLLGGIFDSRPTISIAIKESGRVEDGRVVLRVYPEASSPVPEKMIIIIRYKKSVIGEDNAGKGGVISTIEKGEIIPKIRQHIYISHGTGFYTELWILTKKEEIVDYLELRRQKHLIEEIMRQPEFKAGPPVTHTLLPF